MTAPDEYTAQHLEEEAALEQEESSSVNFLGRIQDSFVVTLTDGAGGTIQKTIIVKDFASISGTFQGMLIPAANVQAASPATGALAGRVTITFYDRATFTAQLRLHGQTIRLGGTLTGALQFTKTIRLKNGLKTLVSLSYDDVTDSWTASLGGSLALESAAPIARASRSAGALAGRYTSVFVPSALGDDQPQAGFGAILVEKNGAASIIGRIAGGHAFTMGARLLPGGDASYFRSSKSFTLAGTLDFSDPHAAPTGSLQWDYMTSGSAGELLPAETPLEVVGSRYFQPDKGTSPLGAVIPTLSFELTNQAGSSLMPVLSPANNRLSGI